MDARRRAGAVARRNALMRSPAVILSRLKVALFEPDPKLIEVTSFRQVVEVEAEGASYRFVCSTDKEVRRAGRLFAKEPGTIAWLKGALGPRDVFYDIGANIGLYTVFAAKRMGDAGLVVSFEPHLPNATSLLGNVEANALTGRVKLVSVPLADRDGFDHFHYHSLRHATSSSQFGAADLNGQPFEPVMGEIKYGCRLATLVASGLIPPPTIVKIDVDGREPAIVDGMQDMLRSREAPREVQIEIDRGTAEAITAAMASCGYRIASRHWSRTHQRKIDAGADPAQEFPQNIVFAKA